MNTAKRLGVPLIVVAALLFSSEAPLLAQAPPTKVEATLADFSWLAGRWEAHPNGRLAEGLWSQPEAGVMMGMFRLVEGEKTLVLEFMVLRETPEGIEFRFRHFGPALDAWEKDDPILLKLVSHDGLTSVFENPVHTRPKRTILTLTSEDSYDSRAEIIGEDGGLRLIELSLKRVK